MSLEIVSFDELSADMQQYVAEQVSKYTHGELGETPQMLRVTVQEIYAKYAAFVALEQDVFLGFLSANHPVDWQSTSMPEVGSFYVPEEHRGNGYGHKLITTITADLIGKGDLPYAFPNPHSQSIFKSLGYVTAHCMQIPPSAFEACAGCKFKSATGCCDEQVIYQGIGV